MDFESRFREALKLHEPATGFAVKVMERLGGTSVVDIRTRRRIRFVVLGILITVGAAAAMLMLQVSGSSGREDEQVMALQPSMEAQPKAADEVVEVPSPPPSIATEAIVESQPVAADGRNPFTILVMPPAEAPGNASARPALEAFHASLIQELRRKPELVLLDSIAASLQDKEKADYRLVVASLGTRTLSSGSVEIVSLSGGTSSGGPRPGLGTEYWPMEATIEDARADRSFAISPFVGADGAPREHADCGTSSHGSMRRLEIGGTVGQSCDSVAQIAAGLEKVMRQQRMDPSVIQQQLLAQIRDTSVRDGERRMVVMSLIEWSRNGGLVLDAAGIETIMNFISGQPPDQRPQQWRMLRSWEDPRLVPPLLDAFSRDADEKSRLELLALLASNYRDDKRVAAAIETTANGDASQLVRMAAQQALHGNTEWNRYVVATLQNAGLPYPERVQPLLASRSLQTGLASILNEGETVALLVKMAREGTSDPMLRDSVREVFRILGSVDHPAVLDLQIELAQTYTGSMRSPDVSLGVEAVLGLMRHREDPRARQVLDQIVAGKGDPFLRDIVEQQLSRMDGVTPR